MIPLPIGEAFAGVLLNYLRYVEPDTDSNKWRWPMKDYWYNLVEDAERISIYTAPGMENVVSAMWSIRPGTPLMPAFRCMGFMSSSA